MKLSNIGVFLQIQFWIFGFHKLASSQLFNTSNAIDIFTLYYHKGRSQWPRGLRRRSAAVCLLRLWARIPPVSRRFFCCEYRVVSRRDLYDELITLPEESYRLWHVVVCDLGNLVNEETLARWGLLGQKQRVCWRSEDRSVEPSCVSHVTCWRYVK
jgi:hypothetical protein